MQDTEIDHALSTISGKQRSSGYAQPHTARDGKNGYSDPPNEQSDIVNQQPEARTIGKIATSFESYKIHCPICGLETSTRVQYANGTMVYIAAAILCLVGCWPFCLLPFCLPGLKDAYHHCSSCNRPIGHAQRL